VESPFSCSSSEIMTKNTKIQNLDDKILPMIFHTDVGNV
jgi:hypothetical protein